jgi:hypothetical protein
MKINRFLLSSLVICILGFADLSFLGATNVSSVKASSELKSVTPDKRPQKTSLLNLTYYFDSREFNTLNILTSGLLPLDFKIFGFVDIHSDHNEHKKRYDLTRFFMEYRLQRQINPEWIFGLENIGIDIEYNDFAGIDNKVLRTGITYKHAFPFRQANKSWFSWRYFPYESDGSGSQASLIFFLDITQHIFISGFVDLNLNNDGPNRWVSEPQLNYKINESFDIAIEYRYNDYEIANPELDGSGFAIGLKIKM